MKAHVKLKHAVIEVEGSSQIDLFDAWSDAAEVFGERCCGLCGCEDIRPVSRKVDDFTFREWHCQNPDCRAKLAFGQNKKGETLFPKRKLDSHGRPDMTNGQYGPHNGWTKYRGEDHGEQEEQRAAQANAARRPAPAPRPAPEPLKEGPVLAKLRKVEQTFVGLGKCARDELVIHVQLGMEKAGHGTNPEAWKSDAQKERIRLLIAEFEAGLAQVSFHDAPAKGA